MKILLIEDEQAAVRRLQKLIHEIDETHEVVGTPGSIQSAAEWLGDHDAPDLILMDIHLADGSSFEIFEKVSITSPVIFATAYDEYALKAFRVNAIDYLLKPIKKIELENAIQKVSSATKEKNDSGDVIQKLTEAGFIKKQKRILVRMGQSIKLIDLNEVSYFYSKDKISFAIMSGNKRYPLDHSLDQIEQMLDTHHFFRINRQFIVKMEAIEEMIAYSKSRVKLKLIPHTDEEAIVSKERSPDFKKWLTGQ